jgi:hypothetical protein
MSATLTNVRAGPFLLLAFVCARVRVGTLACEQEIVARVRACTLARVRGERGETHEGGISYDRVVGAHRRREGLWLSPTVRLHSMARSCCAAVTPAHHRMGAVLSIGPPEFIIYLCL